ELCNQRRGEDHHVGRRSGQQPVAHGADRSEGALDLGAGRGLELRRKRSDETVRGAAGEEGEFHGKPPSLRGAPISGLPEIGTSDAQVEQARLACATKQSPPDLYAQAKRDCFAPLAMTGLTQLLVHAVVEELLRQPADALRRDDAEAAMLEER